MTTSRREFIGGTGLLGLAAAAAPAATTQSAVPDLALQQILDHYAAFGDKASGGPGDVASGHWLEVELSRIGYACRHQRFDVPYFDAKRALLSAGTTQATIISQAPVIATGPQGLTAPLRLAAAHEDLTGTIALVGLPHKRWASLSDPQAALPLADALRRGALGVVLITTGPTGEAIALNVSTHKPGSARPVAVLAPKDAAPFLAAAAKGITGTLILDGTGGGKATRPASNLIARLDRGAAQTVIISTPRSGWFGCAAERGSGLAVWLSLARWFARGDHRVNIELLATSGHEYEYLGGEHYLAEAAPPPANTKLWVHVGASAAARDWHELGARLLPLPNADSQRVLTATADVLDATRSAFRGISGLEATYLASKATAGGELVNVLAAGYPSAIGLYGSHRFFHTRSDDRRCVSTDLVEPVAQAFCAALDRVLG
jgi:hypothetical protein